MDFIKPEENTIVLTKNPLPGYNLTNLLRLLTQNKFKVDLRYMPRILYSVILSSTMAPFRIKDWIKYNRIIIETELKYHPLFIIGHWRSGTTYLHNVLSHDRNLGYFSTFQAFFPGLFLGSETLLKPLMVHFIPEKRPMDDATIGADLPQEEEYAVCAFSPYSSYNSAIFPRNMKLYNKFVCFDDVSKKAINEWKKAYLYLLKKITLYRDNKRLVLKNPVNTARIKLLLEMFPNAKFVHIYRNPYYVYSSMMKFLSIMIPFFCIQKPPSIEEVEKMMMDLYEQTYRKYFKEKKYIPKENLVELSYEDFIQQPLKELKKIYTELHLDSFDKVVKAFSEYISSQTNVKTTRYEFNGEIREKIYKKWDFAFKELGYDS